MNGKTGQVLVRTPGAENPGFQRDKRSMSGGLNLGWAARTGGARRDRITTISFCNT
jgi:hypothetical protein